MTTSVNREKCECCHQLPVSDPWWWHATYLLWVPACTSLTPRSTSLSACYWIDFSSTIKGLQHCNHPEETSLCWWYCMCSWILLLTFGECTRVHKSIWNYLAPCIFLSRPQAIWSKSPKPFLFCLLLYLALYGIHGTQLTPNIVEPNEGLFPVPICELCKRKRAVSYTSESVYANKFVSLELVRTCAEVGHCGACL